MSNVPRHGRTLGWYLLLVFVIGQTVLWVSSMTRDAAAAPEQAWSIVARTLVVPVALTLAGYLAMLLIYRRTLLRNRVLRRNPGMAILCTTQVTEPAARLVAHLRDDADADRAYSDAEFATWRFTVVDADADMVFYDGSTAPHDVLRIPWTDVVDAQLSDVVMGPRSFRGITLSFSRDGRVFEFPLLPVGSGPAGAFPIGRRRVNELKALLRARARIEAPEFTSRGTPN
ncbi:hypothetical protein [Agromyces sp. Root81]|uniref:hypothetical protein n=1 Tax=Agromyces sp. Root81 TaxID=1736601 RepID=UPI0012FC7D15|nr:hypothetical protein [Agromyces sp. Root81]